MSFYVGQRVICVDASVVSRWFDGTEVVEGRIYTVRSLGVSRRGAPGIRLAEVVLSSPPGCCGIFTKQPFVDAHYLASRFRPIVENKSSVSFTIGADPESERWDNRTKVPEKT